MHPIWLLDIDGVINADPDQFHLWPEGQWVEATAPGATKDWRIIAAKPVIDFINKVHREHWAEIVWLTTWQKQANNVSDALGLPHFTHLSNPMWDGTSYAGPSWWKLAEAASFRAQGRPMVWTDDDISHEIMNLFYRNLPGDQEALLIAPKSSEGLVPVHLRRIATFLRMPYGE